MGRRESNRGSVPVVEVPATVAPMIVGVFTSDDLKEHHDGREAEDDDR
jgi:hypothetical protein